MKTTTMTTVLLAVSVAISLSACSVWVQDAPPQPTSSGSATPTEAPDNTTTGGVFTTGDCDGKDVEVKDDSTTVVLDGRCGVVTVTATGATVTLENADTIAVTGLQNTIIVTGVAGAVTLEGDGNGYTGGSVGSITVTGNSTTSSLTSADSVELSGNDNFIVWSEGAASATDSGTGNTVLAP